MCLINKLFLLIKRYEYVLLGFLICIIPLLIKLDGEVNFIYILLTNNYITLIINICYFIIMYKKIQIINAMRYYLIPRMGLKLVKKTIHIFASICTMLFLFVLYGYLYAIYGSKGMNISLFVMLILNTIVYLVETNFIFLQFNKKSNIVFIIIPMILNFIYHYMFFSY